ncbi:helix-turn-helix domain-containing protein [Janthinobacterium fluminis]|uniref:XRE family transcriptional regulator n=1 Tax=Janthinobacterium fluminis TaxID=2987524 RepID=A0ABT5K7C6_9BURK|nr:XRE family transcriptional regulator [Janthinobacterium fluminis]MDC8760912.1 XRE family transcriptional regulator [Janthinobacterium fluminis]
MADTALPAPPDPTQAIAQRIRLERAERSWSLSELAERSGVSKAMISKIERGEASPTATVLGRLSGALGLALSQLLALAEQSGKRVSRRGEQVVWRDPETGYTRRLISPPGGGVLEHLEIELPPQVRVPYPASAFAFHHEQIIVMQGTLVFIEGALEHRLEAGDCLQLGSPEDCTFHNPGNAPCRYLIALVRR